VLVFATGWSEGFDGPGRRWVVYAKGCNLACRWCANPEGLCAQPQMLFYPCRADGCYDACPHGAVSGTPPETMRLDRRVCGSCGRHECTTVWRHPSFEPTGEQLSPQEIAARAERYRSLFGKAGGVTFGGGEATLQADDLLAAMKLLRERKVHVALETNATSPRLVEFAGLVDLLICDLKCVSGDHHQAWTGHDNAVILENLRRVAGLRRPLWVRVPVIVGLNDDDDEWGSVTGFLTGLASTSPSLEVELLPMHHNGEPKYAALDMQYPMAGAALPTADRVEAMCAALVQAGVRARVGGQVW
jgi:pyruvate formate lyase activating enzyme